MKGVFICFEGIDGSGKGTQAKMLQKELCARGRECIYLSYPDYSSYYGKIIRRYLQGGIKMDVGELFLIFLADMARNDRKVKDGIFDGKVVISNRYIYSTIAYQCAAGFDYTSAKTIEHAMGLAVPSVILYLDIPAGMTYGRKMTQNGRVDIHEKDADYLGRVKRMYEKLILDGCMGAGCTRIDGTLPKSKVHKEIMERIGNLI